MSKKRKNNPGGALWLVLGLAAGGAVVWAYSTGVFDKMMGTKPKKKKTGEEKKLPPPKEKDEDEEEEEEQEEELDFLLFDVEEPWPVVPDELLTHNGFVVNQGCSGLADDVDLERATEVLVALIAELSASFGAEFLADKHALLDAVQVVSVWFLEHGEGTEGCLSYEEVMGDEPFEDIPKFKRALSLYVFRLTVGVMTQLGLLTSDAFDEIKEEFNLLLQMNDISPMYMMEQGFPPPPPVTFEAGFGFDEPQEAIFVEP